MCVRGVLFGVIARQANIPNNGNVIFTPLISAGHDFIFVTHRRSVIERIASTSRTRRSKGKVSGAPVAFPVLVRDTRAPWYLERKSSGRETARSARAGNGDSVGL